MRKTQKHLAKLFVLALCACLSPVLLLFALVTENPSSRIVQKVGDEFSDWMKEDSLNLRVVLGLRIKHLPEVTLSKEEKDAARAKYFLARLEKVRPEDLAHEDFLSFDILRQRLVNIIEAPRFYWLAFPVTPYTTPISSANFMFARYVFKDKESADHYLELLTQYPTLVSQLKAKLEGQFDRGIVIPREELDLIVSFLRANIGSRDDSPLGVKSERLKAILASDAETFCRRLAKSIEENVNLPLKSMLQYLDTSYRQKAPEAVGLGQYPGGKDYYAWLVKYHTSLEITPEDVHKIGLREVELLNAKMDQVQASLGFKGTRAEFRQSLKKDPRFFPRTPEEVGERLMAAVRRIEPQLDRYFLRKPKAPYAVKRLEPELEGAQTFGYYERPTLVDPTGYYRYNGSNLSERSLLDAAELIYHELIPGHHLQVCLASENAALPEFRRLSEDSAYAEGWAEYAASLAGEMGMYADLYDLYGRLSGEIFLSTRLVVDTGMNALGWTRSKAADFMRQNVMETDAQIYTESLRYSCDMPGQALAYRIGYLKFRELREKAKTALGEKFDIRRFHDALLMSGSLPLMTLERHVEWFIQKEK